MYSTLLEHWASLYHRITVPRIIRELVLKLLASACIGLYFFGWISFPLFLGLFALSYGANVILLVIYLVQIGAWKWSIDLSFPTSALVKNMAWYSVFIIIGGLGSGIVTKIDGIMITAEIGLAAAATYNIALSMATVIEIPMRALQQISMPIVSQLISEKKFSDLEILYRKASITQLAAGVLLFGGIWINTDLLFRLMPNGELYAGGKMVIFWIGMSKLLDMTTSLNSVIVNHSPYYRFSLVTMLLLAGMAILTNLWLIPILGVEGAALAALLSLGVYNVLMVGFVWLKYKIQPITTGIPKVLIFGAIALGANSLLPELEIWILELILRSLVFTILFGSLVLIFKISPDINQAIFSIPSWINERIHGVRLRDTEK
jgi:O-antigen/teichoic acid export membrane protein